MVAIITERLKRKIISLSRDGHFRPALSNKWQTNKQQCWWGELNLEYITLSIRKKEEGEESEKEESEESEKFEPDLLEYQKDQKN